MKDELPSFWAFNINHVYRWAYWDQAFTKKECEQIIKVGNSLEKKGATTNDGNTNKVRKSEISWIFPSNDTEWIYRRVTDIITELNSKYFKFDIFGIDDGFQFTKYQAPDGKYGKHIDTEVKGSVRKLSFTLQLSSPEDYEGGELCLYSTDNPEVMKKEQGSIALFPSYVLHEVKPVTNGTRYSLVSWVTGRPFV